jgi:hypothetical protein
MVGLLPPARPFYMGLYDELAADTGSGIPLARVARLLVRAAIGKGTVGTAVGGTTPRPSAVRSSPAAYRETVLSE